MQVKFSEIPFFDTFPLRQRVMEPHKPMSMMRRPGDEQARHFGASVNETLVAVASFYNQNISGEEEKGYWRIRGMAVRNDFQHQGLGTKLIQYGVNIIGNINVLWCNSRQDAVDYYKKQGFREIDIIETEDPDHPTRIRLMKEL